VSKVVDITLSIRVGGWAGEGISLDLGSRLTPYSFLADGASRLRSDESSLIESASLDSARFARGEERNLVTLASVSFTRPQVSTTPQ
jgi:hypothetical protein